jgi:3-hydroxybutyryl-CoA dehydrogenase
MEPSLVGVAGLGLLGRGITACLLAHNIPVMAYSRSAEEFESARQAITLAIDELIHRAGFNPSLQHTWQNFYTEAQSVSQLAPCGFVIESIVEEATAKATLFAELEAVLPADTPIASNTSALPISLLQRNCRHPERILGMHWAEPAHATRFLELIRGESTNDASLQAAFELASHVGKDPCIVQQDIPGYIANRIGYAMYREACNLLQLGVGDAATIDRSFRNSVGLWAAICGPFQWIDLTGGPALYAQAMSGVLPTLSNETSVPQPLAEKQQHNETGVRNGHGFYEYTPEAARLAEDQYREHVWRMRELLADAPPPR